MILINDTDLTGEIGCWIAGHRGQYAIDSLAEVLEGLGIEVPVLADPRQYRQRAEAESPDDVPVHLARMSVEDAWEQWAWCGDELTDMLNDFTVGGSWEWVDGELFLCASIPEPELAWTGEVNATEALNDVIEVLINDGEPWTSETIEHVAEALTHAGFKPIWEES